MSDIETVRQRAMALAPGIINEVVYPYVASIRELLAALAAEKARADLAERDRDAMALHATRITDALDEAEAERDALRAEVSRLKTLLISANNEYADRSDM